MKGCEFVRAKEIRKLAWEQLRKNYWMVFVVSLIVYAINAAGIPAVVGLVITGPLMVGYSMYLINNIKDPKNADQMETLFHGFKNSLGTAIIAHILKMVFIFLWSLLFIIPGIVKAFAFSMSEYIIADNPDISPTEALDKSQELMKGNKWRLFCLLFSFIGWFILSGLTFGIGLFFLIPYVNTAIANFYVEIRGTKNETIDLEFE